MRLLKSSIQLFPNYEGKLQDPLTEWVTIRNSRFSYTRRRRVPLAEVYWTISRVLSVGLSCNTHDITLGCHSNTAPSAQPSAVDDPSRPWGHSVGLKPRMTRRPQACDNAVPTTGYSEGHTRGLKYWECQKAMVDPIANRSKQF